MDAIERLLAWAKAMRRPPPEQYRPEELGRPLTQEEKAENGRRWQMWVHQCSTPKEE